DKKWNKKLTIKQLEEALEIFQKQIENRDYLILQFWANITKPNTDILSNVQTTIYSCIDKKQLITTINYLKNISEAQIREILLRAEIQKKEKIIELYMNFPVSSLNSINFNSEIWQSIYQKNTILRIENNNLFKFSTEQYDDINNTIDLAFEKYNPNFEPSPQIELNSNLEDLHQDYCKQIMKSW
ncbi:8381_t:CDS:2, partial [Racocetra persica]